MATASRRGIIRLAASIAGLVALLLVPFSATVAASEAPADQQGDVGIRLSNTRISPTLPFSSPRGFSGMWLWPEGDRAFLLGRPNTDWPDYRRLGWTNLDGTLPLSDQQLAPPYSVLEQDFPSKVLDAVLRIDPVQGRVILARHQPRVGKGGSAPYVCPAASTAKLDGCFGGIVVHDAISGERRAAGDWVPIGVDGGTVVAPLLRAMEYAPPRAEGDEGKVLVVVEEGVQMQGAQHDAPNGGARARGANFVYLAQYDLDRAQREWVVRIDACKGSREASSDRGIQQPLRPSPSAVLRSASLDDPAVFVACHAPGTVLSIVEVPLDEKGDPAILPVGIRDPGGVASTVVGETDESVTADDVIVLPEGQGVTTGPTDALEILADVGSGQFVFKVADLSNAQVWWVYSTIKQGFLGTIGVGTYEVTASAAGMDPATGRLYAVGVKGAETKLYLADTRREPLPQALVYDLGGLQVSTDRVLPVAPADGKRPTRVYLPVGDVWRVLEDRVPLAPRELADTERRTLDLDEVDGVTSSSFDGAARGFGARTLLINGAESLARFGAADPVGIARGAHEQVKSSEGEQAKSVAALIPPPDPCSGADREIILGFVGTDGPVVVDTTGTRGSAVPVVMDQRTRADLDVPVSRCSGQDWQRIWEVGLFGRAPADEPRVPWTVALNDKVVSCTSGGTDGQARTGDGVTSGFAAAVACDDNEANGYGYARATSPGQAFVGEALSSFRVYRDPGRGIVSRIESVARGVNIAGLLRIDTVRGVAESWANGRRQLVAAADREPGYDANCDVDRTAGTCFQRHLFGVWTPAWSCGPCGDERTLVDRMSRAMGANGVVRLRRVDERLAKGTEDGFIAAVQKPDQDRFADLVLSNDLLQTVVPTLEIIRYTNPNRLVTTNSPPRGRQVYQFAGVEVSSSYAISCLLVYDETANTCAAPSEPPGSLSISLTDTAGKALAGGAFEVRSDTDADGAVGLKDVLVPDGACVTVEDGVGTCRFEGLAPGGYLVTQVTAPPGYAKLEDPFTVDLASGEARTVTFINASNISIVKVSASDDAGTPLVGADFAVFADPDADGKVAAGATPAAQCTTDARGMCTMRVPVGTYVLVQATAPAGLGPIDPVAFTVTSGGQEAAVQVVNYPPEMLAPPQSAAAPVVQYSTPAPLPVTQTVADAAAVSVTAQDPPRVSMPEAAVGTIVRIIQAPGDGLRLLSRDPRQATAWVASLALFGLAWGAITRRIRLGTLQQ